MFKLDPNGERVIALLGEALVELELVEENPAFELGQEFDNGVFTLRSFNWEMHENGQQIAQFLYKPKGLKVVWFKNVTRAGFSNFEEIPLIDWMRILDDCLGSIDYF